MNYDQLILNITDLGDGDKELGCIRFLQQRGILHQERSCVKCGTQMRISTDRGSFIWRCKMKKCKATKGIRTNTWLNSGNQGSTLPLLSIIKFIYWWSVEVHSINFCQHELGMGKQTTVNYCSYMRELCSEVIRTRRLIIGRPMCTVEVDESLFTKRKNNAERILPETWVVGAFCRYFRGSD